MGTDVASLMSNSGELLAALGVQNSAGRWVEVGLQFTAGTLILGCDPDTDEVVSSVRARLPGSWLPIGELSALVGMTVEYAWDLTNNGGYIDAFQLRLRDPGGRQETRQFEVAASAIDISRVAA